ncbi:NfeD-like C-terminal, partner-binding [Cyclobacterium lianum]|uniref:NfeD-like C-terminal, partner-binding n=1 Tax=Cyclobacterium lianum TaxID=388280 RepID=A0A1M7PJ65_9BACT|nr:NfeD family protein [Cyclobacterium lianum]SHN16890.1 NfeD-like C-terminal, partner-binding [Cyclobacterium lianum]
MTWIILSSLILFGALLVLMEIIFVPGTTVVGALGAIFTGLGIYYAFLHLPATTAYMVTTLTILVNIGFLIYGFKSGVWGRFALKQTIINRTFDDRLTGLETGQKGRALSDFRPFGKVEIGDKIYEAKSETGFISSGTEVTIIKIADNKIIIKP